MQSVYRTLIENSDSTKDADLLTVFRNISTMHFAVPSTQGFVTNYTQQDGTEAQRSALATVVYLCNALNTVKQYKSSLTSACNLLQYVYNITFLFSRSHS